MDKDKLTGLLAQVRAFETASGLQIEHGWNMEKLGADVQRYLAHGVPGRATLERYRDLLVKSAQDVDAILAAGAAPSAVLARGVETQ